MPPLLCLARTCSLRGRHSAASGTASRGSTTLFLGPLQHTHTHTHTRTHTHTHTLTHTHTVAGLRGGGSITRTRAQRHPSPSSLASGKTVPGSSGKPAQKGDKGGGGGGGGKGVDASGVDASRRNPTWGELAFIGFVSGAQS
jgi:hypothetical protein